jgi:CrcB protein
MTKLICIAAGGAVGALLRYGLSGWAQRLTPGLFPVGTLTVNVIGCVLIGVLAALFAGPQFVREEYRWVLMVGLLGAFTTFSTYGLETMTLVNDGQFARAGLNVLLSNGLGLTAVWVAYRLTERMTGG